MSLLPNIVLANLFLIFIWISYELFLSRTRFFQANRFFLMAGSVLAVILPWLPWQINFQTSTGSILRLPVLMVGEPVTGSSVTADPAGIIQQPENNWLGIIYFAIVLALTVISASQLIRLLVWKMTRPGFQWNRYRIVVLNKPWSAFSFFRTIYYPEPFERDSMETRTILEHERIHARQWHSIDNLVMLIIRILFFYNPAIYLIAGKLRLTHEFIADKKTAGDNKAGYSHTLIRHQFRVPRLILMHSFNNQSFLKRRLIMLSKNKHNRLAGWKYLLVLPLIGGMVLLSGWTASAQNQDSGKKAQVKKEVAQKLQEMGFVKTGEGTWTKEGITMKLSEGSPTVTPEADKVKTQTANPPQKTTIKFTPPKVTNTKKTEQDKAKIKDITNKQKSQIRFTAPVITKTKDSDAKNAKEEEIPYPELDIKPQFPGGDAGLSKWLIETTKYPAEAVEKKISGIVYIQYVISKTGELENVKVLRGIDPLLDAEALRVINSSPKWTPGVKDGQPVRVTQQLPINFTLSKDGAKK